MLRQTCVKLEKPSWRAVICDTSIILPSTKGPRSVMRTIADRPFFLIVDGDERSEWQ
jgi:hypothetical protein